MASGSKTRNKKRLKRKLIQTKSPGTWAEVFAAIDAEEVRDGFIVERDRSRPEERPALDAFFSEQRPNKS